MHERDPLEALGYDREWEGVSREETLIALAKCLQADFFLDDECARLTAQNIADCWAQKS